MTDKQKQQIDDWFDKQSKEDLEKKWNKYNYLNKPKKSIFFIRCYILILKKAKLLTLGSKINTKI